MANTTNFGWETPDDTDLVKDGAAAMRTLGSAIDSSFVDLKGGTTGQLLSKNSNTDLDFVWANAPSAGGFTSLATGTLSGSSVSLTSISGSYKNLYLVVDGISTSSNSSIVKMQLNGDTGATSYLYNGEYINTAIGNSGYGGTGDSSIGCFGDIDVQASDTVGKLAVYFPNYAATTSLPIVQGHFAWKDDANYIAGRFVGTRKTTGAITQINLLLTTGNFDGGSYTLYGEN